MLSNYKHLSNIINDNGIDYIFVEPQDSEQDKLYFREILYDIYEFIDEGYMYVDIDGGFQGFQSRKDMKRKCNLLIAAFYKDELIAASVHNGYKTGRKCVGMTATTKSEFRKIGVKALYWMISYATENWNQWIWIEASGRIEDMYESVRMKLSNSELDSNRIPAYMAIDIMGDGEPCEDGYHYKRYMSIIIDEEMVSKKVRKVMYGFPNQNIYEKYINSIKSGIMSDYNKNDISITEAYYGRTPKAKAMSSYNKLLLLLKYNQEGISELPDSMIRNFQRDIMIVKDNLQHFDKQHRIVVKYILADAELVIDKIQEIKPMTLVETLKERNLI